MRLATHRQQRLDADLDAGADIGRATVPAISEQASDFAQQIGQRIERGEEGRDLLLVIGGLREPGGDHPQGGDIDGRLRVVTRLEAAPATGMMRESGSVRLIWSSARTPALGGVGGLPRGLLPVRWACSSRTVSLALYSAWSRARRPHALQAQLGPPA